MAKRILIADDQMATREGLAKFAMLKGYEVVAVDNGADLLNVVTDGNFDVVITDLVMPDLNGVSAAEILKLHGSKLPIIALTGLAPQDVDEFAANFTRVYYKPVNATELFEYISKLVE